jgi:hypothetical protein
MTNGFDTPPSFSDLLSKPAAEIEEPKVLPVGRYLCIVDSYKFVENFGKNNTNCVDFTLSPRQAIDVDSHLLSDALNGAALADKKIFYRMFVTPDAVYRLKKFLHEDLGVPLTTFNQMCPEAMGKQVIVTLAHRMSPDSTRVFQDVKKTERV